VRTYIVRHNTQDAIVIVYKEQRIAADTESRRVQSFEPFVRFRAAIVTNGANGIAQNVAMLNIARIFASKF